MSGPILIPAETEPPRVGTVAPQPDAAGLPSGNLRAYGGGGCPRGRTALPAREPPRRGAVGIMLHRPRIRAEPPCTWRRWNDHAADPAVARSLCAHGGGGRGGGTGQRRGAERPHPAGVRRPMAGARKQGRQPRQAPPAEGTQPPAGPRGSGSAEPLPGQWRDRRGPDHAALARLCGADPGEWRDQRNLDHAAQVRLRGGVAGSRRPCPYHAGQAPQGRPRRRGGSVRRFASGRPRRAGCAGRKACVTPSRAAHRSVRRTAAARRGRCASRRHSAARLPAVPWSGR